MEMTLTKYSPPSPRIFPHPTVRMTPGLASSKMGTFPKGLWTWPSVGPKTP
jgi:hypothetical protein